MHFVYPRDLVAPKLVDEVFRDEADALQQGGHTISLVDTDALADGAARLSPLPPFGQSVVYRGWMLKPEAYQNFAASLASCDAAPFTSTAQYVNTHYLPHWYPLITDLTPETVVFHSKRDIADIGDMMEILARLKWPKVFVKDFVKSLKTGRGSIIEHRDELPALLDAMEQFRGEIEGGVCFRRVEDFVPGSEQRYFVLRGMVYGADENAILPDVVSECARRIDSPFFSVDVAKRADGVLRVVEIGDGQVSDWVGWTPGRFAEIWRTTA